MAQLQHDKLLNSTFNCVKGFIPLMILNPSSHK